MYVKVVDGHIINYPYPLRNLYVDNPNTSFPKDIPEAMLNDYNVYAVADTAIPNYDAVTQGVEENNPVLTDGVWTRSWSVYNKTEAKASAAVKDKRNGLLAETDYLALSDQTLSTEMSNYRQALRDIPAQSGFPYSVTWPTKP